MVKPVITEPSSSPLFVTGARLSCLAVVPPDHHRDPGHRVLDIEEATLRFLRREPCLPGDGPTVTLVSRVHLPLRALC